MLLWLILQVASAASAVNPPVRGDCNCDGTVNVRDGTAFQMLLINRANWQARYPACNPLNGDCDCDGTVALGGDVNALAAAIQSGRSVECPPPPQWGSLWLEYHADGADLCIEVGICDLRTVKLATEGGSGAIDFHTTTQPAQEPR